MLPKLLTLCPPAIGASSYILVQLQCPLVIPTCLAHDSASQHQVFPSIRYAHVCSSDDHGKHDKASQTMSRLLIVLSMRSCASSSSA